MTALASYATLCSLCDPPKEIPGPMHLTADGKPCCRKHRPNVTRSKEKILAARQDVETFVPGESLFYIRFIHGGSNGFEMKVTVLSQNGRTVRVRDEDGRVPGPREFTTSTDRLRRVREKR